jgi:hypothetical protein
MGHGKSNGETLVSSHYSFDILLTRLPVPDLIKADLNQARANKCLIALVNRKIVTKDSSTVKSPIPFIFPESDYVFFRVLFCIIGKV